MKAKFLTRFYLPAILLVLLAAFFTAPARADIAPPGRPPGADIIPGDETTQVRMVAETVTMKLLDSPASGTLGEAVTHAIFTMRNLGTADEQMEVRFPLSYWDYQSGDKRDDYPEIRDFRTSVNGSLVETRRVDIMDADLQNDVLFPWSVFDVSFPVGEDVTIEVFYTTEAFGDPPFPAFRYILHTGAGWNDVIGSADIIIQLPYEASSQNVLLSGQSGYGETTSGTIIAGDEVRWHFEDFEPTLDDDITLVIVNQEIWLKILKERENVADNPNDGEAWGRLGLAYKNSIRFRRGQREDAGGRELYNLSVQAYEKAVEILPNDADWHAGFADLLWTRFYYVLQWDDRAAAQSVLIQLLEEISTSLALDPNNETAIYLADDIFYSSNYVDRRDDGEYVFLALTTTPTFPTWTPTPAEALQPTATLTTLQPTNAHPTLVPAPVSESNGPTLPCTSGAMILSLIGLMVWSRRRRL